LSHEDRDTLREWVPDYSRAAPILQDMGFSERKGQYYLPNQCLKNKKNVSLPTRIFTVLWLLLEILTGKVTHKEC
jgi:hypothetical protein